MGWGFRKRIKIAPGVHLNLSKRGISGSVGGSPLSVKVGRGTRVTGSVPGTGLSYSKSLSEKRGRRPQTVQQEPTISLKERIFSSLLGVAIVVALIWWFR
ncbi:DUF4236 domain-containing protein [Xanthobacter sp. VTT E-85241]|uniref:DUF4236 domain-containing protein n=1 Tax=Roseixanthobacter finlandensis TaxID=3119922 RepID=UPI003727DE81